MKIYVLATTAVPVRRKPGSNITIVNQSATDVYFDPNPNRVNASVAGATPDGTKLAAGGQIQFSAYPNEGVVWFRSATNTTIEVTP